MEGDGTSPRKTLRGVLYARGLTMGWAVMECFFFGTMRATAACSSAMHSCCRLSLLENRGGIPSMERALSLECQRCRDWRRGLRIWCLAISAVGLHRQGADESCRRC